MSIEILVDSCCDLPLSFIENNKIPFVPLTVNYKGAAYKDDFGMTFDHKKFYNEIRQGEMPTTSQVNVQTYIDEFEKHVKEGKSLIYIGFSSALSGSVESAFIAKNMINENHKDADITVIDSKSASMGVGLLVYYAYKMKENGSSKDEIVDWVENNKLKVNHWFTVDDLNHLKRGGRISKTAATLGTVLSIKPILKVNDEGKLIPFTKIKGRKKSIKELFNKLEENIKNPEEQIIAISHGDCPSEAENLKKMILEKYNIKDFILTEVGPVIGAHSGPGTLAVFFMADGR